MTLQFRVIQHFDLRPYQYRIPDGVTVHLSVEIIDDSCHIVSYEGGHIGFRSVCDYTYIRTAFL